ncbi:Tigger transposable element-derived protein 1 [Portunus trituberculatus]|uniref:Tigger transposable element-derived protein 1 n=1 Tax=Portunus trituberculatus TaxID=210409 RepID=A0A5B7IER6_PORTR|nr:Tigger transposable element-derived protein 1 [Portunus trituberculatus]
MPHKTISSPSPKKHNFWPSKDKLELIRKCEAGIAHSVVAVQMGVPKSTVTTIWKNRDQNRETAASTTSVTSLVLRGSRDSHLDTMEDMLIKWIEDRTQHKMPISMGLVQVIVMFWGV